MAFSVFILGLRVNKVKLYKLIFLARHDSSQFSVYHRVKYTAPDLLLISIYIPLNNCSKKSDFMLICRCKRDFCGADFAIIQPDLLPKYAPWASELVRTSAN